MRNETLETWILLVAMHTCPDRVHWCDGSDGEMHDLYDRLLADGTLLRLNDESHPGCFLHRSEPSVAGRLELRRFVSTSQRGDAGPTNRWLPEDEAYRLVWPLFARAMSGRTLFVVPYLLGSSRSKYAEVGVQLTDSPLCALLLGKLTRMGRVALEHLGRSGDFVRGLHCLADLRPERRYLVHFPATQTCWSIGTSYPESGAFGLEGQVLCLAGARAPEEGYLAEHMAIASVKSAAGRQHYIAAAFPAGCGKTRLATLAPSLPGWKVEMVADGACLLRAGDDGRLWAMNPALGIEGMIGAANRQTDPGVWTALHRDTIFTNVALREDRTPWWEGSGEAPGEGICDWQGRPWQPGSDAPAAHPNARFITAAHQCSSLSSAFYDPVGVPLSAILFGARRRSLAPLIFEAMSWEHGVYVGATCRSEDTSCFGEVAGELRNDPMAMLPFCSYNMADYFGHWLRLGRELPRAPRIFHVNWFGTDARGGLLWPGFGENIRVLDWVLERVERAVDARRTAIGFMPRSLDMRGLDLGPERLERLFRVDVGGWLREAEASQQFLASFGERLPPALGREHSAFVRRLRAATN